MSEMTGRAALALMRFVRERKEVDWYNLEDARAAARVVIEALREPSEAMVEAGNNTEHTIEGMSEYKDAPGQIVDIWQAMIKEALH